jgi:hypothetical protein
VVVKSTYGGLIVASVEALPELPIVQSDHLADLSIAGAVDIRTPTTWTHQWVDDSTVSLALGRVGQRHILQFEDGALYEFDRTNRTVGCPARLGATARHQLLDQVLPRVFDALGHLMIHGSAIDTPKGANLFIGEAGRGKSTLAASFASAGVDILSDDCFRLIVDANGAVKCMPTYRTVRLWPDSADAVMPAAAFEPMAENSDKRRLGLPRALPSGPFAVSAVYVLAAPSESSDSVRLTPVAPARAVSLLLAQCFRLDPTDAEATKRTFERCADIVERVPVVELSYPRTYDRLPEVRDAVLRRAPAGGQASVTAT